MQYEDYTLTDVLEHEELIERYNDGELDEFFSQYVEDYEEILATYDGWMDFSDSPWA